MGKGGGLTCRKIVVAAVERAVRRAVASYHLNGDVAVVEAGREQGA